MRAHSLPLPYLTVPSLSFLVHVSPRAYLTLLRKASTAPTTSNALLPSLDVPFSSLRPFVGSHPRPAGVTTANLYFSSSHESHNSNTNPPNEYTLVVRPTFALVSTGDRKEIYFPTVNDILKKTHGYILDFTDGGRHPGVIMSQMRMHEIQLVLDPIEELETTVQVDTPVVQVVAHTWVDMLVSGARMAVDGVSSDAL